MACALAGLDDPVQQDMKNMTTVFEARTGFEAHMMRNLLLQAGITARVLGEDLIGAMGELPAMGLVRVVVRPDDEAVARQVIADWEAATPMMTRELPGSPATE